MRGLEAGTGGSDARKSGVILQCRFVKDLKSICDESLPSTKILSYEESGEDDDDDAER